MGLWLSLGLLAAPDQFAAMLARYREIMRHHCGRDIPLAITEYNGSFVQSKPIPYRLTLGTALFVADYLRVLLQPETNILMANYWQFINEYWGELKGPRRAEPGAWVKRPAYYVHWLYQNHFGDVLVPSTVTSPTFDCEGFGGTQPARGTVFRPQPEPLPGSLLEGVVFTPSSGAGWQVRVEGEELVWTFEHFTGDTYPGFAEVAHEPGLGYHFSGEAQAEGDLPGVQWGIQVGDDRGWPATHSAAARDGLQSNREWTPFTMTYLPLEDPSGLRLNLRCEGAVDLTGTLRVRDLQLTCFRPPAFPAVPLLSVNASRSTDGQRWFLMVVNKSADRDLRTELHLAGFLPSSAHLWTLTGPALEATNEEDPRACTVREQEVPDLPSPLTLTFPARSLTAVELRR